MLRQAVALVTLAVLAGSYPAGAQCTSRPDVRATAKIASNAARCIGHGHRLADACTATDTTCSGTFVHDLATLVSWPGPGPLTADDVAANRLQLSCQRALGVATAGFLRTRVRLIVRGVDEARAIAASERRFRQIARACRVTAVRTSSGALLPSLGGACAGTGITPGLPVDVPAVRSCLEEAMDPRFERLLRSFLRPNLVFLLTDDQPLGMLDVMPNVQALAAAGVTFTHAAATTPVCAPSRASFLTGQYAHTHGVLNNDLAFGGSVAKLDDRSTIATWLQGRGYRTALIGKYVNGYAGLAPTVPPGWDTWRVLVPSSYYDYDLAYDGTLVHYGSAPEDYSTDVLGTMATDFVRSSGKQPFFLWFAPYGPHDPATPAPRHVGTFAGSPPWRPPNWNEADVSDKPLWLQNLPLLDPTTVATYDALRESMLESLLSVDEAIGAIVAAIRETGNERNTFIVFASDNGFSLGAHRLGGKLCPYEECFRVPMIARYPRYGSRARSEDRPVANIDVAPTLAELAGATPTIPVEGASLLPLLDGTATEWRDALLIEQWTFIPPHIVQAWAPPSTYIEYAGNPDVAEFYDLAADPYELTNGAADPAIRRTRDALATRVRELVPQWSHPPPP